MIADVSMAALAAVPHMYKTTYKQIATSNNSPSNTTGLANDIVLERGRQKITEMYGEYKTRGLIPDDFPEITLIQMKERIENFIKNILDSFTKQNLDPLTNLDTYGIQLTDYQKEIFHVQFLF